MDKNKKNVDYWDKYYGSGKNKKKSDAESYSSSEPGGNSGYNKYKPKDKEYGSKKNEPEGRIVGSEYKVKSRDKKRRKSSPALRLTILIIIVFLAGFFTFYAIDNHLFSREKTSGDTGSTLKADSYSSETSNTDEKNQSATNDDTGTSTQSSKASSQEKESSGSNSDQNQGISDNSGSSILQSIIAFFKNIVGRQSETDNYPKKLDINFYFVMIGNEGKFGCEQRTIVAGSPQNAAVSAVNELLKGSYESFNFTVIPAGTKLLGVEVLNKIAKINLSQEFLSESLDSSILDEYIIYTIVDTLTEIPEIEAVSFLIDGKEIKEYGNVDLNLPAIRNEKYLD
ncbi:MAG: GerMN domain-containing protein [Actinobacteria bacterium]|nr:GerMN domain-containing protein [Actinomycetota bacterium]